ncbi:hypothetical protein [uncultured Rhodospira sp.]|uniref:hypothetical protein n=1 Tax=uncultured Rhodospira sp. TaxID=1936189 RepID=UPI00260881F0|nr:hypothetical protein [uncultured Rhodospira sp.]
MPPVDIRRWHRLFGIALTDLFADTSWRVELEKELALKSQLLDVAIIEGPGEAPAVPEGLPDGLDGLRAHNLLTYKSQHEALTAWTLDELIGHYVSYRKLTSPKDALIPEAAFGLFAVATRFPEGLAREVTLKPAGPEGVFDVPWGARHIRLVVLRRIARHPRNAPWELFSAEQDRLRDGVMGYRARRRSAMALLRALHQAYQLEDPDMAYTMEDFLREERAALLDDLTPEERQRLIEGLSPEDRLKGLSPDDVLRGFGPDELRRLKDRLDRMH